MSTLKSIELLKQEKDALNGLTGALINLSNVRHAQTEEEKSQLESYRSDTVRAENLCDSMFLEMERIMEKHGIPFQSGKLLLKCIEERLDTLQPFLSSVSPVAPVSPEDKDLPF